MSASYDSADQLEKSQQHLERLHTAGGHVADRSQPALPVVHRSFANPSPLGLLAFATGVFLISMFGLNARGLTTPNLMIGVLMFFGGVCQMLSGVMEFITGNTFGATLFPAYAAFNFSFSMIYLPGTGILAAYTDPETGAVTAEFNQALAIYLWAWFIVTVVFTVGAMRSSWVLFLDLVFLSIFLLFLAAGTMVGNTALVKAGYGVGLLVSFLSYWASCAGLWAGDLTPINLPTFAMHQEK